MGKRDGEGSNTLTDDDILALKTLHQAITKALSDADTNALFGAPVDTILLPDYTKIVQNPRDLQSIADDIQSSLDRKGPYSSANEALQDVQLVWDNCFLYNNRPEDASIIDICKKSKLLFQRCLLSCLKATKLRPGYLNVWKGVGQDVRLSQNAHDDPEMLPMKGIDGFEITSDAGEPIDLLSLGHMRCLDEDAVLSGEIRAAETSGKNKKKNATLGRLSGEPVIDWAIDMCEDVWFVWVITKTAWYKLMSPSRRYATMYQNVALAIDMLQRAVAVLWVDGNPETKDIVETILDELKNEGLGDSRRKSVVPVPIKKFVTSYLEAYCGRRVDTYETSLRKAGVWDTDMEIDAISDEDMPDDFDPEDEILDDEDFDSVRKKAWRTAKYRRKKALNDKIQMEKDKKRYEEESQAHEERGEPPAMSKSFRVPKDKVHDVLFLWSFFQEFGDLLRVPPFSFHALEAAFCPGPSVSITIDEYGEDMEETKVEEPVAAEIKETDTVKTESDVKVEEVNVDVENPVPHESEPVDGNDLPGSVGAAEPLAAPKDEDPSKDGIADGTRFTPQENGGGNEKNELIAHQFNDGDMEEKVYEEEKSANVQAVPVKRGRGRPRKDGSAPRPRAPGVNPAPQNIINEPTIKTRRQRGISVPSKHMAEYASMMELEDEIDDDEDYRVVLKRHKSKPHVVQPIVPDDASVNAIAEALKQTQKMQEEYEASIKEKYGVSSDIIKKGSALDKAYAPSGILLRDIVLALLGVIDETLPKADADIKRPSVASTTVATQQKHPWPEEVANNVWSWDGVWQEAKAAALHLAYGDFVDLSVEERIDVVLGLLYEAIESNFLSNEISRRSDNYLQQQVARLALPCEQPHGNDLFLHYRSEIDSIMTPIEDSLSAGERVVTEWDVWKDVVGVGTKAFIGEDFGGRRYWALGDGAGAFRVYCQEVEKGSDADSERPKDTWGWYEGFRLDELILWLKKSDIHQERHLIAALTSAPSPTSSPTPGDPARKLSKAELSNWRLDGYKNTSQPLLRGEWNLCKGRPTPLSSELRVSQTIESMLGSISFWFKDNETAKLVYGISDIIMTCNLRDTARALLEADRVLIEEKKVTQEWIDVWSPKWRTAVASCLDLKEVPLQIASLQSHVIMQADVIPRGTYLKILDDLNCILTVPIPSDNIVVLKSGLLQHIEKAMHLLNIQDSAPNPENSGMQEKSDKSSGKGISGDIEAPILPLKEESINLVKGQWTSLKKMMEQLKPVQRYVVRGITYRRHLADLVHVSTEGFSYEEIAIFRRPVAWLYLKPIEYGPRDQMPDTCLCAPIVLDPGLVDYLVPLSTYINQSRVDWTANDRFKMFVPPRPSQRRSKSTGYWKKGTVVENLCHRLPQQEQDPWESITVEFDSTAIGETSNISPWKLEIDPDEEQRMLQEAHKLEQSVARAQRARSSLRSTDEEEAFRQETEWQLEDMRLEEALTQAGRSEHLLQIHAAKTFVEPGQELNMQYHSDEEKQKYQEYLQNLGSEVFSKYAAYAALASNARAKDAHKSSGSGVIPSGPLTPGQQVDPKILQALRILSRDQFMMLVTNFYIGLKGKYKIPIFAHRELDLFTVWWSVMERCGYERVTNEKQWKDICRSLNLDLSGQTSASYNMRLNYERCLLDFENYLACGQYELDLAQNKAPVHTHAMNPATTRFVIPGAYEHVEKEEASAGLLEALQPAGASKSADHPPTEDPDTAIRPLKKIPLKITTPKSTLIKLKPSAAVTGGEQIPPVTEQFSPTEPLGPQITSRGPGAIGLDVSVFWSDEGGWWRAEIVDYDHDTSSHRIVYNKGTPEESFEWVTLSALGENELRLG